MNQPESDITKPLVSVILPAFNAARFLERALDSVRNQTYPANRIEVLLVDDGSTDESLHIAEKYEHQLYDLKVCSQPNQGVSSARNLAILLSNGDLIAFLDADDRWLPDKISQQVAVFDAAPTVGLVHCGCTFVDQNGKKLENWSRRSRVDQGDVLLDYICDFFLITSSVMIPRTVLDDVGYFNESLKVGEDNDLFLRIVASYLIGCAPQPLLERTVRSDSLSREDYELDAHTDLQTLQRFLESHPEFARENRRRIDAHFSDYLFSYGYRLLEDGRLEQARDALKRSLRIGWSTRAGRTLIRSYLPTRIANRARAKWT